MISINYIVVDLLHLIIDSLFICPLAQLHATRNIVLPPAFSLQLLVRALSTNDSLTTPSVEGPEFIHLPLSRYDW